AVLLLGIVWLEGMTGPVEFTGPDLLTEVDAVTLRLIFFDLRSRAGCKGCSRTTAWMAATRYGRTRTCQCVVACRSRSQGRRLWHCALHIRCLRPEAGRGAFARCFSG